MRQIFYAAAIVGALLGGLTQTNAHPQHARFYGCLEGGLSIPLNMIDRAAVAQLHPESVPPGCGGESCFY